MNKDNILAHIMILLTVIFWGVSATSISIVLREVPPATLAFIRFSLASLILYVINKKVNSSDRLKKVDKPRMIICGIMGITLYFILETYGIKLINPANATILLASIPIFTLLGEFLFLKRQIKKQEILGSLITIIGVSMVIWNSIAMGSGITEVIGSIAMILAAICWSCYSILNKKLENKYNTVFNTMYQSFYGAIFLIPLLMTEVTSWQRISLISWLNILYLTIFCSALCTFMYLSALKKLGATLTNVYINLMPFIGVLSAYIVLNENIYLIQLYGGVIIILGIFMANLNLNKDPKLTEKKI